MNEIKHLHQSISYFCLFFIILTEFTNGMMSLYKIILRPSYRWPSIHICQIITSEAWEVCPVTLASLPCIWSCFICFKSCIQECWRLLFVFITFWYYVVFTWQIWNWSSSIRIRIDILLRKSFRCPIWLLDLLFNLLLLFLLLLWSNYINSTHIWFFSHCSLKLKMIFKSPSIQFL